ncbi:Formate dehydrogenase [Mycena venus]|uniref:Formate dehydrogenase n=1 Tax=Mycena venus TaxID=2733690 RepID=A0A8H6YMJ2_9AGAR|nr:Formate dehydrogenase [Mycena venus]
MIRRSGQLSGALGTLSHLFPFSAFELPPISIRTLVPKLYDILMGLHGNELVAVKGWPTLEHVGEQFILSARRLAPTHPSCISSDPRGGSIISFTSSPFSKPLTTLEFLHADTNMKVLAILYDGKEAALQEPRLLGTTENKLGIADWLQKEGHEFIGDGLDTTLCVQHSIYIGRQVSSSKEGPDSDFQKHIVDAEVLITTPFHPGYLTKELIEKAKNLKLCITAGVGSDHIDLNAAVDHKIQVLEVSGSNVVSVAEHVVMSILLQVLVRNFMPAHEMIERGDWQVSDIARNAFDLEGKVVGTIGAGRIGYRVLQRLVPFDCKSLLYYDYAPLPAAAAQSVGAVRVEDLKEMVSQCDVVTVNCPLHEGTRGLVNDELLKHFKKGAWLVNTARGAICDKDAVARALKSGHLSGYSGDVWNVQPAPKDHVWRTMKNPLGGGNGMVPHYSGTTLDAQARYAAGAKSILENYLIGKAQEPANIIVGLGKYESKAYGQR